MKDIGFILAIVINLLVLSSYNRSHCEKPFDTCEGKNNLGSVSINTIRILGIIEIILSTIIVLFFLFKTAPILIKKAWEGALNE